MTNFSSVSVRVRLHEMPTCVRALQSGLVAVDVATGPTIVTAVLSRSDFALIEEAPTKYAQWSVNLIAKIAHVEATRICLYRCKVYVNEDKDVVAYPGPTPEERDRQSVVAELAARSE
jgi:hypothetical protein